jgi:hypothetical protein
MKIIDKNESESGFWSGTGPRLACPVLGTGLRTTRVGGGGGGEGLFLSLLLWNSSDPVWHTTPTTVHSTVHMWKQHCRNTNIEQSNKADIKDWEKPKLQPLER